MRVFALIAVVLIVSSLAAPARAGMLEDCEQDRDPDLAISACTAVIRSGEWQGQELAWAYNNRGLAYANLGEYGRAIEDYDQALRLDPGYVLAYNNRGFAYKNLGEYRRAIEDYDQARLRRIRALSESQSAIRAFDRIRCEPAAAGRALFLFPFLEGWRFVG